MEKIKHYYEYFSQTRSDINEHLPTLYEYSKKCTHLTEMGVRSCVSTWALLFSNPNRMVSYDVNKHENVNLIVDLSKEYNINFEFKLEDVLEVEIENTDLLFIDTWHTYNQLSSELDLHSKNVNKYIILHDTVTYGFVDESMYDNLSHVSLNKTKTKKGLMNAVNDFIISEKGSTWEIKESFTNNNGLLILKNKNYNEI